MHQEYDSLKIIGDIPAAMRLTDPVTCGGIEFMMNSRRN